MLPTTTPSALRIAGGRTWLTASSNAALRQRWFSTSPTHRAGHLISFGETSTPELSELLDNFRQKVILPTYLAGEQRKKIYKAKLKHFLQNDPVTMEIDGVVHKFRYVNQVADLPNAKETWVQSLRLMKTRADFDNVAPLLQGCKRAGRKLPLSLYPKIIRRAAMHDRIQVVIDCAKVADRTGFKLNNSETINQLLVWLQRPAIESGWDSTKTNTALKQIRLILNMIESDEHHAPTKDTKGAFPFHRDPQVLAARLHMAAARAVHLQGGKDEDGIVAKYAAELVSLWPEDKGLLDLQPDSAYHDSSRMRYMLGRNGYLWHASPVLNGLTLAAQVVDPALAMQLQNRADKVESEVKTALASSHGKPGRGVELYNAIFNPGAKAEGEAGEDVE